ncbi:polysaccharide pyruvyl transferase family protein [uncultured Clostridium sp.]|uniref:polysaccharide pyruvyl transferase family protein n=1 Tax=uncultured Clostridium sp. TaxID=59620 RepID=UPI00259965A6|nr:polysaccharide pyruvyl transferase family protein [uncultured Clostridium sp.]
MKIRIEHTSNPLNYGTNMMVTNFMYYLDKEMKKNNTYLLDVTNNEDLENYKRQYNQGDMEKQMIDYDFTYASNIMQRLINKIKRDYTNKYATDKLIKKMTNNMDVLIVLGGDDLSEYYSIELLKKEFYRLNSIKKECKTILVGQTIGPFKEERIQLAKESFNGISIYSRDPWTTRYLKNDLDAKKVEDSADLAFLPLPGQDNLNIKDSILKKYNIINRKYITIVPSGLYKSYCSNKEKYVENIIGIINYISKNYKEYNIVLLPHVLRNSEIDDRNIIKEIENKLGKREDIIYIYDEMSPLQARFILGNGELTITGRMHGAISTLQMRKPAISIAYSVKYKGVIGEGLNLNELIVEGSKKDDWEKNTIEKNVCDKLEYIFNNYNNLIEKIDDKVKDAVNKSECMIKNIAENLK